MMKKAAKHFSQIFVVLYLIVQIYEAQGSNTGGRQNPDQKFGYVDVRPGAHLFWWLYYTTKAQSYEEVPLVLYIEGGPGVSFVGYTNFEEIGPLDLNLQRRKYSWVKHVNLLFVDSPVGTGFSFVDDLKFLCRSDAQIAKDLLAFVLQFFQQNPEFQTVPFYIFGHSYGGKATTELALRLQNQMEQGNIRCNFKGIAVGNAWISPIDSVAAWGPYLYDLSFVDSQDLRMINERAQDVARAVESSNFLEAFFLWGETRSLIFNLTNQVNFVNIMIKKPQVDPNSQYASQRFSQEEEDMFGRKLLDLSLKSLSAMFPDSMINFVEGPVRQMLGIIPDHVKWSGQSVATLAALGGAFMRSAVPAMEKLLERTSLTVTVYIGNMEVSTNVLGVTKWVENLNWPGIQTWETSPRKPLILRNCTKGFVKSSERFSFYWILNAGHRVLMDTPAVGIEILKRTIGAA